MRDQSDTILCARAQDLVAYLYGEASEQEARDFEGHLRICASCGAEFEAFGHVRADIGAWLQQTLGSIESPALGSVPAPALETAVASSARKPSALAALREFFALSPVWLRAATAFTGLAVCALVVFAAARLMEGPRVVVAEKVIKQGPSEAEVNALVDKRVQEQLAGRNQREDAPPPRVATTAGNQKDSIIAATAPSRSDSLSKRSNVQRRAPARVSTQESEQLARDLQLIPTRDEEDLPRLIDLMDEAN